MKNKELFELGSRIAVGHVVTQEEISSAGEELKKIWFDSNCTDFSIYDDIRYSVDMLFCWRDFSSKQTTMVIKYLNKRNIIPNTFLDFHGGLGLSGVQLALAFPDSVIMTHTVVSEHRRVALELKEQLSLDNLYVIKDLQPGEVCLAQETFEHFKDPYVELRGLLNTVNPKYFLNQSSFTIDAPGHFRQYYNGETPMKNRKGASKAFNDLLRTNNYEFWWKLEDVKSPYNGHPRLWVR